MKVNKRFNKLQLEHVLEGKKYCDIFQEQIETALCVRKQKVTAKRHWYFTGGPGIGKTFIVNEIAQRYDNKLIHIQSVSSMNAICIQLATAAYLSNGERIFVWIDDCDNLFREATPMAAMKGILDEDRNVLSWNKNLTTIVHHHENSDKESDKIISKALRKYQVNGGVGVEIPLDNFTFIVSSNHQLTAPNPPPATKKQIDESAIRDRVNYRRYALEKEVSWGWVAHIVHKAELYKISKTQKNELLTWMLTRWDILPSVSLRAVNELAAIIVNEPDNYINGWELHLQISK
jgi:hypothetical protein